MRPWCHIARAVAFVLLPHLLAAGSVHSAEKISATILVKDCLAAPHQQATIEVKLVAKGLLRDSPLGGEPVELIVNGATAATSMTGGDGRAFLSLVPAGKSIVPLQVRVGGSPRVAPAEGYAHLVVWERRTPVLVVELSSLMEDVRSEGPLSSIADPSPKPMAAAADELAKLSQFYYGILYVTAAPSGADGFATSAEARSWLAMHKFPSGLVLSLPPGEEAIGAKIDELHEAGWKSIKTGIGRSKPFVEAFLHRRLDAIMILDPSSGEAPRKAKVARDWKEVRKKL